MLHNQLVLYSCTFCNKETKRSVCDDCMREYTKIPTMKCDECKQQIKQYLPTKKGKFARLDNLHDEDVKINQLSDICLICYRNDIKFLCHLCNLYVQKYHNPIVGVKIRNINSIESHTICDDCYLATENHVGKMLDTNVVYCNTNTICDIHSHSLAVQSFRTTVRTIICLKLRHFLWCERIKFLDAKTSLHLACSFCSSPQKLAPVTFHISRMMICEKCITNIGSIINTRRGFFGILPIESALFLYYMPINNFFVINVIVNGWNDVPRDIKKLIMQEYINLIIIKEAQISDIKAAIFRK
jgi:copper chaperone CopZ